MATTNGDVKERRRGIIEAPPALCTSAPPGLRGRARRHRLSAVMALTTRRMDAVFLAAAAALVVAAVAPWPHDTANAVLAVADALILPVACLAAADSARRFEAGNPARVAWWLLSVALAGFWVGEAWEGSYTVRGLEDPFPSIADVFFLLAYPVIVTALLLFLRAYRLSGYGEAGATVLLVTAATVGVLGLPLLVPILRAPLPALERLVSGAYGMLDLVALIPLLRLLHMTWAFRGGSVWQVWASLLFGFLLTFAGDVLVASRLVAGTGEGGASADTLDFLSSVMFTLSYLAIARGTLRQRELLRG
jgi:hypothetical protein